MFGTGRILVKEKIAFFSFFHMVFPSAFAEGASSRDDGFSLSGEFPEILVTEIRGFLTDTGSTGSILNVDRMESTRSVGILDNSLIEITGSDRVEEIAPYLPGVISSTSYGGVTTTIFVRGFQNSRNFYSGGELFLNGHRDNQGLFVRDLATIERIEILKGHDSVLYGSAMPAATLNYITKRPKARSDTRLSLTSGDHGFIRFVADSTGPLGSGDSFLYRTVVAGQDGSHPIYDNVRKRQWTLFNSLSWNYTHQGSLRVEAEYSENHQPYYFGTVYVNEKILYDQSYVFPEAKADRRNWRIGVYWNQRLSDKTRIRTSFNHFSTQRDDTVAGFYYRIDDARLAGYYRLVDDDYRQNSVKMELISGFSTGMAKGRFLLGVEHNEDRDKVKSSKNTSFILDPLAPDLDIDLSSLPLTPNDYITNNRETGIYLFNRLDVTPAWALEIGTRYSRYYAGIESITNNIKSDRTKQDTWSGTFGVRWKPVENISCYFNLSDSFKPNWGTDRNNQFFDPLQARQAEVGVRYRSAEGRWNVDTSIYQINQKNLLKRDPEDWDHWILAGERRSEGLELSLQYIHSPSFSITTTYSYINAEYIGEESSNKGKVPASIPEHSGSLRVNYFPATAPDWQFFAGVIAVGDRFGDDENSFEIPGYTRLDMGIQYSTKNVRVTLSGRNVTDERYIVAASSGDDIYRGEPRAIRLSVEWAI